MKKVKVAYPNDKDIDSILALEHKCFRHDRLSRAQLRYLVLRATSTTAFVVKRAKDIIAYAIVLSRKNSAIARLYSIAVDPDFQQRGIARLIYNNIERRLTKHGYEEIRLEVRKDNRRAIRFYLKNGYQHFDEYKKYYEDGQDGLRMKKSIST